MHGLDTAHHAVWRGGGGTALAIVTQQTISPSPHVLPCPTEQLLGTLLGFVPMVSSLLLT